MFEPAGGDLGEFVTPADVSAVLRATTFPPLEHSPKGCRGLPLPISSSRGPVSIGLVMDDGSSRVSQSKFACVTALTCATGPRVENFPGLLGSEEEREQPLSADP